MYHISLTILVAVRKVKVTKRERATLKDLGLVPQILVRTAYQMRIIARGRG